MKIVLFVQFFPTYRGGATSGENTQTREFPIFVAASIISPRPGCVKRHASQSSVVYLSAQWKYPKRRIILMTNSSGTSAKQTAECPCWVDKSMHAGVGNMLSSPVSNRSHFFHGMAPLKRLCPSQKSPVRILHSGLAPSGMHPIVRVGGS